MNFEIILEDHEGRYVIRQEEEKYLFINTITGQMEEGETPEKFLRFISLDPYVADGTGETEQKIQQILAGNYKELKFSAKEIFQMLGLEE